MFTNFGKRLLIGLAVAAFLVGVHAVVVYSTVGSEYVNQPLVSDLPVTFLVDFDTDNGEVRFSESVNIVAFFRQRLIVKFRHGRQIGRASCRERV